MFCKTVLCGQRLKFWNTNPKFRRIRRAVALADLDSFLPVCTMLSSPTVISPELGVSSIGMHRNSVLFPEPLGPMMEMTSPSLVVRSIPRRTSCEPKDLHSDLIEIAAFEFVVFIVPLGTAKVKDGLRHRQTARSQAGTRKDR